MFWKLRRKCKHTAYKLEADFSFDPIWCNDCGWNLDVEDFPLSDQRQEELSQWIVEYGEWIDFETDSLKENGLTLEKQHNEKGMKLFNEVKKELGEEYTIIFVPSTSAQFHKEMEEDF